MGRGHLAKVMGASMLAAFAMNSVIASHAAAEEYLLGAQDTLKIRVYEWKPVTGTAFEWVPLNGEFVVSAAGNISLPIIGSVHAAGLTLDQMSEAIGERLKEQVGMQKRPNASVEISEYRPFFITGLVTKPGKFSYIPGLTVVQALSMAGGATGPLDTNAIGLQRDVVTIRGDIRGLAVERYGLLARQARVDAILQEKTAITFPAELLAHTNDPNVQRTMSEEEDLFNTRENSLNAEIASLNEARVLASNQIDALKSKATSLAKQIDMASKDVGTVNKLVSAGLTVSTRSLGANQNLSDLESRNLDVSLASLKAQQDIAKVDRDVADARNRYRVDTLTEAADLRVKLEANAEKMQTARALLENIAEQAPVAITSTPDDEGQAFETTIDRVVDGSMASIKVSDNDLVRPGDVLRVQRPKEPATYSTGEKVSSTSDVPKQNSY